MKCRLKTILLVIAILFLGGYSAKSGYSLFLKHFYLYEPILFVEDYSALAKKSGQTTFSLPSPDVLPAAEHTFSLKLDSRWVWGDPVGYGIASKPYDGNDLENIEYQIRCWPRDSLEPEDYARITENPAESETYHSTQIKWSYGIAQNATADNTIPQYEIGFFSLGDYDYQVSCTFHYIHQICGTEKTLFIRAMAHNIINQQISNYAKEEYL